jgi:hypothetical protein
MNGAKLFLLSHVPKCRGHGAHSVSRLEELVGGGAVEGGDFGLGEAQVDG